MFANRLRLLPASKSLNRSFKINPLTTKLISSSPVHIQVLVNSNISRFRNGWPRPVHGIAIGSSASCVRNVWPSGARGIAISALRRFTAPVATPVSAVIPGGESASGEEMTAGDKGIAYWLLLCSGVVFAMVVIGGLTRLTKSGLSMVDWKLEEWALPANDEEWQKEFEKYQQYPEYQKMNKGMELNDFKFIYCMEWGHRMLGRTVGVLFAAPFLYFLARGRVSKQLGARLAVMLGLGAAQGGVGWWMVKSGLEVSPYRLAAHLLSAFVIYSMLFNTALQQLPRRVSQLGNAPVMGCPPGLKAAAVGVSHLIALTVASGAFVAGNEAGLIYNEFPLMGGRLVPSGLVQEGLEPKWRNFFENSTTVQFDHRVLGTSTFLAVCALYLKRTRTPLQGTRLPREAKKAADAMLVMAGAQVSLGISTLLYFVPVPLAALHQAGSLTLLTLSLWFLHALGPKVGSKALAPTASKTASQAVKSASALPFALLGAAAVPPRMREVMGVPVTASGKLIGPLPSQ